MGCISSNETINLGIQGYTIEELTYQPYTPLNSIAP